MWDNRKQVFLAAGGSVALHVLFLLLWAFAVYFLPKPKLPTPPAPAIHLQLVKAAPTPPPLLIPEATPTPTPNMVPFIDTSSRPPSATPPANPRFESNQDTEAASRLPAKGDKPLPTLHGKAPPRFAFNTTLYHPGEVAPPSTAPTPPPSPLATPAQTPPPARPPKPAHTPVPDAEFGLAEPTPTPEDTEPVFDPSVRGPASSDPPPPTVASRSANRSNAVGFQMSQQTSNVSGNIGKRGEANVDSVATPVGRYRSMVIRAISAKWYSYFYARGDIISLGMVRIHINVDRTGRVLAPRVLSNSSNEALATVSLQAVADAPIPPMPQETISDLKGSELSMDLTFNAE